MKKFFGLFLTFAFLIILPFYGTSVKAAPPTDFQTTQLIGSGLSNPTALEIAPDGRIFIIEQKGRVLIYKNGQLLGQPFAVLPTSQAGGDLGLLGIVFDPQFISNHYVYFYYTSTGAHNTIVRYDATNDVASGSPFLVYESNDITQQYHAGGTIQFGSDGKIYLSIGDNGYPPNAQNLSNSLGKIHRINKDGTVPADNPFFNQNNRLNTIWAYGFRNPFRFQIDPTNGRIYVGDVGEQTWEEVNLVEKGLNYGWPTCEGNCSTGGMVNPMYAYNHNGNSASITGGFIYHGNVFPSSYANSYFFADYANGFIKNLFFDGSGNISSVGNFDLSAGTVVDLKQANDGSFYYLTIFPGRLYKVSYNVSNHSPTAVATSNVSSGPDPLSVNFSSVGSSDLDGDTLTYFWNFGDGTNSTNPNPTKLFNTKGKFTVLLTVSDGVNQTQATPIVIQVGTPPVLTISTPLNNSSYKAGDTVQYIATATSDGQNLPDSAFTTEVIFHHLTHTHPFLGPLVGNRTGNFTIPVSGENSTETHFEIKVTATDSFGLTTSNSVNIQPTVVNLNFVTNPANLNIMLDSQIVTTPDLMPSVVGFKREINVPVMQLMGATYYQFDSWSDGGSMKHFITTPNSNSTLTANLKPTPPFSATYFNNVNLSGTPVLTRNEGMIDYNFEGGSPDPLINSDNFSIRFVKQHYFGAGMYKFDTLSDDGVRLYLDNVLIIDKWVDQGSTLHSSTLSITEGNHEIKLEYYERGGGANVKLIWDMVTPEASPTPPAGQNITSFTLINADTDQVISTHNPLVPGQTLNLQTLPTRNLNIRANTNPAVVGSVRFAFDGNSNFGTENNAPYALGSDENGNYFPWTPSLGSHTVTATPYAGSSGTGISGTPLSLTFNVIDSVTVTPTPTPTSTPVGQHVISFTLINADTDQVINGYNPITANTTLNLQTLPTRNLNIRANTSPATVGSVRFAYDGNGNFGTENNSPYALGSDNNGNYFPWTPSLGSHIVTATTYSNSNGGGTTGTPLSLAFNVIDQTPTSPTPTPTLTPSPTPTITPTATPTPSVSPAGQSVVSFSLVNADTDEIIPAYNTIANGSNINLSTLPTTRLNIIANTNPDFVGSVRFSYDSTSNFQTENIPPYALAGDDASDYFSWTPGVGNHTLTATPFTNQNSGGTQGNALTITFTISN